MEAGTLFKEIWHASKCGFSYLRALSSRLAIIVIAKLRVQGEVRQQVSYDKRINLREREGERE